jgi:hypothetical protein
LINLHFAEKLLLTLQSLIGRANQKHTARKHPPPQVFIPRLFEKKTHKYVILNHFNEMTYQAVIDLKSPAENTIK